MSIDGELEDVQPRIKKEENRLKKIFRTEAPDKLNIAIGLIERAAFIRVNLEILEQDIKENGWVEMFTQSAETPAYERERIAVKQYNNMVKTYNVYIKQLNDLLPAQAKINDDNDDSFEAFMRK